MDIIPYARQSIDADDIAAVASVLSSDWLTTGPAVAAFESAVAGYCGVANAVALSSGTAALHTAMFACDIAEGDEVIVPAMTFAASANCVLYQGGSPVFADVDPSTLLIDPDSVEGRISKRTKAIIAVDYAGQPCDYQRLTAIARRHNLCLVADACHSIGAGYMGKPCGSLADLSVFSFHPVKQITSGEGGMLLCEDQSLAERARRFRNHGIDSDIHQRARLGTWYYEMTELGYNYRISDIQCALGQSQLSKLPSFLARRQEIARRYQNALAELDYITPLAFTPNSEHSWHLFVVILPSQECRDQLFTFLRADGIHANVHYIPVHLHPYYQKRFNFPAGYCPVAESLWQRILSLPIWPGMEDGQVQRVIDSLRRFAAR